MRLYDVAFCKDFACNLVSLRQLHKRGYWWDNKLENNYLRRANDDSIVACLQSQYNQFILEFIPYDVSRAAFHARRNKFNSWTQRRPIKSDARKWHLRLGHPGPGALEHLVNCSQGARIRGPNTVECEDCGCSKAKRQISRAPRDILEGPGLQLAIDFHDYEQNSNGFRSSMLISDRWSSQTGLLPN
jgi:hypothetical protein